MKGNEQDPSSMFSIRHLSEVAVATGRLTKSGVAVEKIHFLQNDGKFEDRKCL
jgi:hypothetical protein